MKSDESLHIGRLIDSKTANELNIIKMNEVKEGHPLYKNFWNETYRTIG